MTHKGEPHHPQGLQQEIKRHREEHHKREQQTRPIHPLWFVVLGSVLVLLAVGLWILMVP